jgi:hypothetical protein
MSEPTRNPPAPTFKVFQEKPDGEGDGLGDGEGVGEGKGLGVGDGSGVTPALCVCGTETAEPIPLQFWKKNMHEASDTLMIKGRIILDG